MSSLALLGGKPAVPTAQPHYQWPPAASLAELRQLAMQRNNDIVIKGNAGPIGKLEQDFLDFLQRKVAYAVAYNSGTSGLLAAYVGVGIDAGDEVLVPAITYHAAVSPLMMLRARPILVDVDQQSWCIDATKIEAAITKKTKAITIVHQWGHPAEMKTIMMLAKKHHLKIIEDCSHAHGSRYRGRQVGTFGDVAVFSLQANKLIFAGEGGMLVTSDQEIYDRAILLGHYRDRARDDIVDEFYHQFWVTGYGMKLRMSPFNAIVGLFSLRAAEARIEQRHRCLNYFARELAKFDELVVPQPPSHVHLGAWYGFKPRFKTEQFAGVSRQTYIAALQAEGVEVDAPSAPAFSSLPLFQVKKDKLFGQSNKKTYKLGDFPIAERLAAEALSLPTFTNWQTDKEIMDHYLTAFAKVSQARSVLQKYEQKHQKK